MRVHARVVDLASARTVGAASADLAASPSVLSALQTHGTVSTEVLPGARGERVLLAYSPLGLDLGTTVNEWGSMGKEPATHPRVVGYGLEQTPSLESGGEWMYHPLSVSGKFMIKAYYPGDFQREAKLGVAVMGGSNGLTLECDIRHEGWNRDLRRCRLSEGRKTVDVKIPPLTSHLTYAMTLSVWCGDSNLKVRLEPMNHHERAFETTIPSNCSSVSGDSVGVLMGRPVSYLEVLKLP